LGADVWILSLRQFHGKQKLLVIAAPFGLRDKEKNHFKWEQLAPYTVRTVTLRLKMLLLVEDNVRMEKLIPNIWYAGEAPMKAVLALERSSSEVPLGGVCFCSECRQVADIEQLH